MEGNWVTVQDSAANLTLTATCGAAVVLWDFRRIPFTLISDFSTHNSSRIQKASHYMLRSIAACVHI
jgi:hypothetical protein